MKVCCNTPHLPLNRMAHNGDQGGSRTKEGEGGEAHCPQRIIVLDAVNYAHWCVSSKTMQQEAKFRKNEATCGTCRINPQCGSMRINKDHFQYSPDIFREWAEPPAHFLRLLFWPNCWIKLTKQASLFFYPGPKKCGILHMHMCPQPNQGGRMHKINPHCHHLLYGANLSKSCELGVAVFESFNIIIAQVQ